MNANKTNVLWNLLRMNLIHDSIAIVSCRRRKNKITDTDVFLPAWIGIVPCIYCYKKKFYGKETFWNWFHLISNNLELWLYVFISHLIIKISVIFVLIALIKYLNYLHQFRYAIIKTDIRQGGNCLRFLAYFYLLLPCAFINLFWIA